MQGSTFQSLGTRTLAAVLISHEKKFIYTKTAKTAGTSVEVYFEKYCAPSDEYQFSHSRDFMESNVGIIGARGAFDEKPKWYSHMSLKQIKAQLTNQQWSNYFKFCVIRSPFDLMISYFYFKHRDLGVKDMTKQKQLRLFRTWLQDNHVRNKNKYQINGKLCMDYFIRYEKLNEGIQDVCAKIDVPFESDRIQKLKSGYRNSEIAISEFYDARSRKIIETKFAFEIAHFNYNFEHSLAIASIEQ